MSLAALELHTCNLRTRCAVEARLLTTSFGRGAVCSIHLDSVMLTTTAHAMCSTFFAALERQSAPDLSDQS